jgi:transcription initiation factor TFIIB
LNERIRERSFDRGSSGFCGECSGSLLSDPESGELVCTKCGTVSQIPSYVESHPNPRIEASSTVPPLASYEMDLPTMVGNYTSDRDGGRVHGGRSERLRQLNEIISLDSRRRNFVHAVHEIRRITDALSLGSRTASRAYEVYRSAFNNGLVRGRSIASIAAASVFVACKEGGIARSASDILDVCKNRSPRQFRYYYKLLLREMNLRVTSTDPSVYVPKIAANASLSGAVERLGLEIVDRVRGRPEMLGKRPVSIAAAALYLASIRCGEEISQLRLASASQVTPITIRKRSSELSEITSAGEEPDLRAAAQDSTVARGEPVVLEQRVTDV